MDLRDIETHYMHGIQEDLDSGEIFFYLKICMCSVPLLRQKSNQLMRLINVIDRQPGADPQPFPSSIDCGEGGQ